MPEPRDRFDDLPAVQRRVGAHRAEQPRLRAGLVVLWAVVATLVLVGAGIFGTLVTSGRIVLFPEATPTATATPEPESVVDTSYNVLVLNATPESGLAAALRDQVVAAGWPESNVYAGDAGSEDFEVTTVYYATREDEPAARGLAQAIGSAQLALNDVYQQLDDPATADDESAARQLTIVIGLDRTTPAEPTS